MRKATAKLSAAISIGCLCLAMAGTVPAQEKSTKSKDAPAPAHSAAKRPDKAVDINNATEKDLITLPGVGAKTAKEIVAARPFKTVDDLKNVKGIGDKTFEKLKVHVVCNPVKK